MPSDVDPSQPPIPALVLQIAHEALRDQSQTIDSLDAKLAGAPSV